MGGGIFEPDDDVPAPLRGPLQRRPRAIWRGHARMIGELWPDAYGGTGGGAREIPWRLAVYGRGSLFSPELERYLLSPSHEQETLAALFAHDAELASFYTSYLYVRRALPPEVRSPPESVVAELVTYFRRREQRKGRPALATSDASLARRARRDIARAEDFLITYTAGRLQRNIQLARLAEALLLYLQVRREQALSDAPGG